MGRRVAVLIGVASAGGGLVPLPAVRNGVAEFGTWAVGQGFELVTKTDFDGSPVFAHDIYDALAPLVTGDDLERLFVYFAGHGVALGGGYDLWLLNDVHKNPNQAINVALSAKLAKKCGVPHVVFFADACRSPAGKEQLDISGISIFPQRHVAAVAQLDQFYATTSGDSSFEKVPEGDKKKAFGIFTRCLMTGLKGEDPRAVREVRGGPTPRAVLASSLRSYLEASVPLLADEEAGVLQIPECLPLSDWQPNVLAWLPVEQAPPTSPAPPTGQVAGGGPPVAKFRADRRAVRTGTLGAAAASAQFVRLAQLRQRGADLVRRIATSYGASVGPAHFETGAGLTVVGADLRPAEALGVESHLSAEDGRWHIRGRSSAALLPLVLGSGERRWAGAAILAGYMGTLIVGGEGVEHVEYLPTTESGSLSRADLREVIRWAGARAWVGSFDPDADDPLLHTALRQDFNPTLILLAAYHYDRIGADDAVQDLLVDMLRSRRAVPLDLLLLSDLTPRQALRRAGIVAPAAELPIVPAFPLRAAGWALLDAVEWMPVGDLLAARPRMASSPWTTFRELPSQLREALLIPPPLDGRF